MNLIVDVGNTFVKFAIYEDANLIHKISFKLTELKKQYISLKKDFPKLKYAIISSVGRLSKQQIEVIKKDFRVIELSYKTKVPFKNLYQTPKTLGVDRIALVSASVNVKEIDGVIDQYRLNHQDLTVILTGGDAKFLSNQLKNSIFANSNFLLEGLNFILDYNSK